jgi:hypothetical protein
MSTLSVHLLIANTGIRYLVEKCRKFTKFDKKGETSVAKQAAPILLQAIVAGFTQRQCWLKKRKRMPVYTQDTA